MHSPFLIFDPEGFLGRRLIEILPKDQPVVFVSASPLPTVSEKIVFVPLKERVPRVPRHSYSKTVFIQGEKKDDLYLRLFKEARKNESQFILVAPRARTRETQIEKLKDQTKRCQVLLYGDLFAQDFLGNNSVGRILIQAKTKRKILVEGSGVKEVYPVCVDDLAQAVRRSLLKEEVGFKLLNVFPRTAITELGFAHLLQSIDPRILIDFARTKTTASEKVPTTKEGEYVLDDPYPLKKCLESFLNANHPPFFSLKDTSKKKRSFSVSLFLCYVLFFLLFPLVLMLSSSFVGLFSLKQAGREIMQGNLSRARQAVTISQAAFTLSQKSSPFVLAEAAFIGKKDILLDLNDDLGQGKELSKGMLYLIEALEGLATVFSGEEDKLEKNFFLTLQKAKDAKRVFDSLNTTEIKQKRTEMKDIDKFYQEVNSVMNIVDVFPQIFGFTKEKTYLVIFQNNMELRPGGGFIGSYGLVRLDKGRLKEIVVHDVYEADGQLKGHVEPPFPIRRYLPSVHWYLRDSNFSLDFSKSASQAAFFLREETGQVVDGVIGIDVTFIKNLLRVVGPVYVPDYKETVTADNLYLKTQTYAEKNFFPGSTAKKDFLKSLLTTMIEKLSAKKEKPSFSWYASLVQEVVRSAKQKHALFAFSDTGVQRVFTVNKLTSSLMDERSKEEARVNDFLAIAEANVGVNKANAFISRRIEQEIQISQEGRIEEKVAITYQNDSQKGKWPGGDYKNYLRIFVPFGAKLSSISIDGQEQKVVRAITDPAIYEKNGFLPPKELEVEEGEEAGKTFFGFLLIVPAQEKKIVNIAYQLPFRTLPPFTYDLWLFKQSGTEQNPFSLRILYPKEWKALGISSNLEIKEGEANALVDLLEDTRFIFKLSKR